MTYETLKVRQDGTVVTVSFNRPEASNALNAVMIRELVAVVASCLEPATSSPVTVLVLRGDAEVFCTGGDLSALVTSGLTDRGGEVADPAPLYDLWCRLATAPFVTVSLVRGRVNAGGVGFISASDIVLADASALFSLSELLFGLYPACVLPFLVRRIGRQRARYATLMTRPFDVAQALAWGLVDAVGDDADALLRQHLLRLRRLNRSAVAQFKTYLDEVEGAPETDRARALAANRAMFLEPENRRNIQRYVEEGRFPWEA